MKPIATIMAIALGTISAFGQELTLDEAKELFADGAYEQAATTLAEAAKSEPKNASLNNMAGVALMNCKKYAEARPFLMRGTNEANLHLARIAMERYEFDDAEDFLDKYEAGFKKGKGKRATVQHRPEADEIRTGIEKGRSMLDGVEKIVIIDSITVELDKFMTVYNLAQSAGHLLDPAILPRNFSRAEPTTVYSSENGDFILWGAIDENEDYRIASTTRLADGSWERPTLLDNTLNEGGDANYPFLMSDGITLYFANNGENSLGGYDIFLTRKDGDGYVIPRNIGMPYNSYANDYLLAIDEENNIGWWATDRNAPEDMVTVYTFLPGELRQNYDVDFPGLESRARIDRFRDTWENGTDYTELRQKAKESKSTHKKGETASFRISIPGKGVYTSPTQFKRPAARRALELYIEKQNELQGNMRKLDALRKSFAKGQTTSADAIIELEQRIPELRQQLLDSRNAVISAEF